MTLSDKQHIVEVRFQLLETYRVRGKWRSCGQLSNEALHQKYGVLRIDCTKIIEAKSLTKRAWTGSLPRILEFLVTDALRIQVIVHQSYHLALELNLAKQKHCGEGMAPDICFHSNTLPSDVLSIDR